MLIEDTVNAKEWLSLIVILNSGFCAVKDLGEPREDFGLAAVIINNCAHEDEASDSIHHSLVSTP